MDHLNPPSRVLSQVHRLDPSSVTFQSRASRRVGRGHQGVDRKASGRTGFRFRPRVLQRDLVVPKVSGGWRPVIGLSTLNRYLEIPSFAMETPEEIRLSMLVFAWKISIDLKAAYFHVSMRPSIRRYLRVAYRARCGSSGRSGSFYRRCPGPSPCAFTSSRR